MQDDQHPDDSWLALPVAEDSPEAAAFDSPAVPPPAPATTGSPAVLPSLPRSRFALESLENPYHSNQPTPTHWAVGWADLMMTMFVLFLVMYLFQSAQNAQLSTSGKSIKWGLSPDQGLASQSGNKEQGGANAAGESEAHPVEAIRPGIGTTDGHPDPKTPESSRVYDLSKLAMEDKRLAEFAEIELASDRTVRIILAADLLFPSGSAEIKAAAKENIKKIAGLLRATPYLINVVGHTDNQPLRGGGPFATNWELSVMRASTVTRFLIEETGLPSEQFTVSGHSFYQPQADNDTPASRAKNRRVEIMVSRDQLPALTLAPNPAVIP